jgi:hypothetical protein
MMMIPFVQELKVLDMVLHVFSGEDGLNQEQGLDHLAD